jgi:hypothetical protein
MTDILNDSLSFISQRGITYYNENNICGLLESFLEEKNFHDYYCYNGYHSS